MRKVTFDRQADILRAAFDSICDPDDWKGPIDALVPYEYLRLYVNAVGFMTGTECEIYHCDENHNPLYLGPHCRAVRIISVGYRAGPAGP